MRFHLVKALLALSCLALGLAACASEGSKSRGFSYALDLTDDQLASRVEFVLEGEPQSVDEVALDRDPNADPSRLQELEEPSAVKVKWSVRVLSEIKGSTPSTITIVTAPHVADDPDPERGDRVEVGARYRFYVTVDLLYLSSSAHFSLVRARRL